MSHASYECDADDNALPDYDDGPPGSPSSATTITHAGRPYPVTPDERSTLPMRPRHIRRRSSHLQRWIQEQQCHTSASPSVVDLTNDLDEPRVGTPCNPYLAYPHISLTPARHAKDDLDSLHSYDLIADDDIPAPETVRVEYLPSHEEPHLGHRRSRSFNSVNLSGLHPPPSMRSFNLSFRSASPSASGSTRSPSRLSIFHRSSPAASVSHSRSSSLSTLNIAGMENATSSVAAGSTGSRWRPSVMGHFPGPSVPEVTPSSDYLPRPSMSSTTTYSSNTSPSTVFTEAPSTPPKPSFMGSIRSRAKSSTSSALFNNSTESSPSSSSLVSTPGNSPPPRHGLVHKASMIRMPFLHKSDATPFYGVDIDDNDEDAARPPPPPPPTVPEIVYTNRDKGRLSLAALSTPSKRKKKLVVSGIGRNDMRRLEGLKAWCESFGEVSQIMRMPNSDLHVYFRKAEVADTVCRIRAKVQISSVGSVQLSWYTGNQRT
ncbi:hypothetical protein PLICRDRAFT_416504 [Plicaturopsis crispa FD-325 SS-3]|nr:hypothetical protein PLICRDRAFT_416504 [Plicaturopsis crispa FD-325 SS-3]